MAVCVNAHAAKDPPRWNRGSSFAAQDYCVVNGLKADLHRNWLKKSRALKSAVSAHPGASLLGTAIALAKVAENQGVSDR